MQIVFATSNRIGARLIRIVTWSDFSHVAVVDGDMVIEAVYPKVRTIPLDEFLSSHLNHALVTIPCPDDAAAIAWARLQIGKPYDLLGMLGLGFHRDWQDDSAWWCSEHAPGAALAGGTQIFRTGQLHRITPHHLWMLNFKSEKYHA